VKTELLRDRSLEIFKALRAYKELRERKLFDPVRPADAPGSRPASSRPAGDRSSPAPVPRY
jgi:hypothetical protein